MIVALKHDLLVTTKIWLNPHLSSPDPARLVSGDQTPDALDEIKNRNQKVLAGFSLYCVRAFKFNDHFGKLGLRGESN